MELVGFARGEIAGLKEWISLLRTTYWPHKAKQADGETVDVISRLGVTPIIPISIIFPEESLDSVLGMVKPEGKNTDHIFDKSLKSKLLKSQMKKAFGLKDLPKKWEEFKHPTTEFLKLQNVQFHAVGIKEDTKTDKGVEML